MKEALTVVGLILTAAVTLLGVPKAIYEYRQARLRTPAVDRATALEILRVETEPERLLTQSLWEGTKVSYSIVLVTAGVTAVAVGSFALQEFGNPAPDIATLIFLMIVLAYCIIFGWITGKGLWWMRGKHVGEPLHKAWANLRVKGSLPAIMCESQRALLRIDAVRVRASRLDVRGDKWARIEGTNGGGWGAQRRHEVTIQIDQHDSDTYSIAIVSTTYAPDLVVKRRDVANVTRILQHLYT
jgi:hypothetical protein